MLATAPITAPSSAPDRVLRQAFLAEPSDLPTAPGHYLLGIIDHGLDRPRAPLTVDAPAAIIPLEVLDGVTDREAWFTNTPVRYGTADDIAYAQSETLLFGVLRCPADEPGQAACTAYQRIIKLTRAAGAGPLLRLWHYFPDINRTQAGLERYRRFCQGRYEALAEAGFALAEDLPAASAIGTRQGDFQVLFLAGRGAAMQVENPLQTSAFRYPPEYSPRSPSFSRAIRYSAMGQASLLISGTASILGHQTVQLGDVAGQCAVTLDNLRALLAQVGEDDLRKLGRRAAWKVYLRRPDDLDVVRDCLGRTLDPASPMLFLAGDICREALLLEIEGLVVLRETPNPC